MSAHQAKECSCSLHPPPPLVLGPAAFPVAQQQQRTGQVLVGLGVVRLEPQGPLIAGHRLGHFRLLDERHAQVEMPFQAVRRPLECGEERRTPKGKLIAVDSETSLGL